jgi:hypothetical protein
MRLVQRLVSLLQSLAEKFIWFFFWSLVTLLLLPSLLRYYSKKISRFEFLVPVTNIRVYWIRTLMNFKKKLPNNKLESR